MTSEDHNSISFILGLNQFQEGAPSENVEATSGDTNHLLAGLNTLPSASPEHADEAVTNFANQLSLWTNASFSFDGPMGHALIGDEEKEPSKTEGARREDEEDKMQRYYAASSAHSNAARDKNRELDREARTASGPSYQGPLNDTPAAGFAGSFHEAMGAPRAESQRAATFPASQPGISPQDTAAWRVQNAEPGAPAAAAAPGASGQSWDLTSTLALQYLLSKNPNVLQNLPQLNGAAQAPQRQWQPPASPSSANGVPNGFAAPHTPVDPFQLLNAPPHNRPSSSAPSSMARSASSLGERAPASEFTFAAPSDASKVPSAKKRSSSSALSRSNSTHLEPAPEQDDDQSGSQSDSAKPESSRNRNGPNVSDRVKLVDTGNPEADAETNRQAIEEDKRRRNTAASARFRVKKKQREAALEMSARELESQVNELKQDNERLRTENEWLKRLITARPEGLSSLLGASVQPQPYPVSSGQGLEGIAPQPGAFFAKGSHDAPQE